jgi:YegS/Rv2252/BmrU family lipid kinase
MLEARIADLERRSASAPDDARVGQGDMDGARRHALLIFNPASGRESENNALRLSQIVSSLRAHGIHAHIGLKTSGKTARRLALGAVRDKHDLVVVAAGDGTIEEIASQLCGTKTVLGIVPIGTMNNIARSLGVPLDIDDACALIGMGTTRTIDMGRVISSERKDVRHFIEGAGVGLGALAVLAGQAAEKKKWRVIPRALTALFEAKAGNMRVEIDDDVVECSTHIVTVSNGPLMGGNLLIAPSARMDDGVFDIRVYDGMNTASLAKHFVGASKGEETDIKTYRGRKIRITSEEMVMTHSDKDVTRPSNVVEIEIVPRALSMIVGNGLGLSVPVEAAPVTSALECPPDIATNGEVKEITETREKAEAILKNGEA